MTKKETQKEQSCGNCGKTCPTKHVDFVIDTKKNLGGLNTPEGKKAYKDEGVKPCLGCEKEALGIKKEIKKHIPEIDKEA